MIGKGRDSTGILPGPILPHMQSVSMLERWNDGVADLLIHRDRSDIVDRFLAHLSNCVDFDQWYAALFHRHEPAERIGFRGIKQGRDDYEDGLYLLDPFYQQYRRSPEPSVHRLGDLARPGDSARSPYFERYLRKWDTRDEVGYLVPIGGGRCVHLSVSRSHDLPPFERDEVQFLASLVSVVSSVFALYERTDVEEPQVPAIDRVIGRKLAGFGANVLTAREGEIVFLLLKGYTAAEIAGLLEISHGTAKNHIKSIYRKLNVRSQVELLVTFIDDLYE